MERRVHRRFPRRVEVRFWRQGEPQSHSAFSTNISKTGLFLGSATALQPGERLRLELVEPERGFVVEGRVARVHRVSIALRHVEQPGVGVRFLTPEELIDGFLPAGARQAGPAEPMRAGTVEFGGPPPGSRVAPEAPTDQAPSAAAPEVERRPQSAVDSGQRIVPVTFDEASAFLSTFHRDIQSGGLFVSTQEPADLKSIVWIELHLPLPDVRPELFQARVVQKFEPSAAVGPGRNVLAGMAVQFLDPERVVSVLRPLLAKIRGS